MMKFIWAVLSVYSAALLGVHCAITTGPWVYWWLPLAWLAICFVSTFWFGVTLGEVTRSQGEPPQRVQRPKLTVIK